MANSRANSRLQSPLIDETISSKASKEEPLTDLEETPRKSISSSHNSLCTSNEPLENSGFEVSKEQKSKSNSPSPSRQSARPEEANSKPMRVHYEEDEEEGLAKISVLYHKGHVDPRSYSIEESIKHELNALQAKAL